MVKKLLIILVVMVPFLFFSCGKKEEAPVPESKQPDIENLETIETSEIPSLYDDEDDLLFDEEPMVEDSETENLVQTAEPDSQQEAVREGIIEESIDTTAESSIEEKPLQKEKEYQRDVIAEEKPKTIEKVEKKRSDMAEKKIARATPPSVRRDTYKPLFDPNGKYIVSLASFKQKQNAINLKNKFKYDGFPVSVVVVNTQKSGTYYRVNIGNFATKSEAEKFGRKILASRGQKYWINVKK